MNRKKSKELYAKSVINAMGWIDDDLILEAAEQTPVTPESNFFRFRKQIVAVAASFVFVALIAMAVIIGRPIIEKQLTFLSHQSVQEQDALPHSSAFADILLKGENNGDGSCTVYVTGYAGMQALYIRPESSGGELLPLLYEGAAPQTKVLDGFVYYVIPLGENANGDRPIALVFPDMESFDSIEQIRITDGWGNRTSPRLES